MDAVILAAGRSTRMGEGRDKQLDRLGGKPLMVFAIEKLLDHDAVDRVVLTTRDDKVDRVKEVLSSYSLTDQVHVIVGGVTRQESVSLALEHVESDRVLIHEAARPLISAELIDRVTSPDDPAVVPVIEVPFTVAVGGDQMTAEIERKTLRNVQLPQVFNTAILKEAHSRAAAEGQQSTEDSQLVFRLGVPVTFVAGLVENIKVTYPADLVIAHEWIFGDEASR
jgi:2-C-methyl-D-erythritol 4-phosphate cytidylyltransferase